MNNEILEKAGLSKNEIKVYLALIEEGESTSGPLIRRAGINSSKVYESIQRLEKKGLVSFVKKTNKRYFQATEPQRLLDYLENRKKQIEDEMENVEKILPELEAKKKKTNDESQEATIYQGFNGYKTLLENMLRELNPNGKYIAFASGKLKEILGDYWYIFQKKKSKYKIKSRNIWDSKVKEQKDYLKEYYGTGRFLTEGSYSNPVDIWVYNDKIIQVSYTTKPIFAVLIKSKGLAKSYLELFEDLWKTGSNQ